MILRRLRWACCCTALLCLGPAASQGEETRLDPVTAKKPGEGSAELLWRNRLARPTLASAVRLIREKKYESAFRLLQLFLRPDVRDGYVQPGDADGVRYSGLKAEVLTILSGVPSAGQALYEKTYGPQSRQLLAKRTKKNAADVPRTVAVQYPLTNAGMEAEYELSNRQLRNNAPLTAAFGLQRLVRQPYARKKWGPLLSLRTAVAWGRGGQLNRALAVLETLRKRNASGRIALGGKMIALYKQPGEAIGWLVGVLKVRPEFRGIEKERWTRNKRKPPPSDADTRGMILGPPNWKQPGIFATGPFNPNAQSRTKAAKKTLAQLRTLFASRGHLTIPVDVPHIVNGPVIHRAGGRIQARGCATPNRAVIGVENPCCDWCDWCDVLCAGVPETGQVVENRVTKVGGVGNVHRSGT